MAGAPALVLVLSMSGLNEQILQVLAAVIKTLREGRNYRTVNNRLVLAPTIFNIYCQETRVLR